MLVATDDFGAVVVDERIYAVGGQTGPDPTYVDALQVYDPEKDSWNLLPPMPSADGAVRAAAIDDRIYVLTFASDLYVFDTGTQQWSNRASFSEELLVPDMIAVGNTIYVFGGFSTGGTSGGTTSNLVYAYDAEQDAWSSRTPMPTRRSHHRVILLDDLIYVLGGSGESGALSSMDVYDPDADEWTSSTSMPVAMENFGAVAWNGQIHALVHKYHYIFNPETAEWTPASPMITSRHGFGIAIVDHSLYVIGGCYEDPRFNTPHNEILALNAVTQDRRHSGGEAIILVVASLALMIIVFTLTRKGIFHGRTTDPVK